SFSGSLVSRIPGAVQYRKLQAKGKNVNITIVAVARELAGFIWDMGRIAMSVAQQPQCHK
ncbi:TPA: hypothetical protein ACGHS7_004315, partial [Shigella boydii]